MDKLVRFVNSEDLKLFHVFNNKIKCIFLDAFMPWITNLGNALVTIMTCFILIFLGKGKLKIAGFECLTTLATSHILVQILKRTVTRPRPFSILSNINTFDMELYDYSFPSGHTTAAFSIGVTLTLIFPSLGVVFIFFSMLVGLSRVYLGVHYPSDVLVGIVIAIMFSIFNHILLYEWLSLIV